MFNLVTFGKSFITSQQSGMKDGLCLASRQERRRKQQIDQNLFHLIRPLFVFIRLQSSVGHWMDLDSERDSGIIFG